MAADAMQTYFSIPKSSTQPLGPSIPPLIACDLMPLTLFKKWPSQLEDNGKDRAAVPLGGTLCTRFRGTYRPHNGL